MLPQLSYCCCGCTLQTGTILIGAYQIVRGLFEIVTDMLGIATIPVDHPQALFYLWEGFPIVEAILGSLKIIVSVVLIFGANKERYRVIFWCLIVTVSLLIIELAFFPLNATMFLMNAPAWETSIVIGVSLADFALELYFLWVVFSYYRIIEERAPAPVSRA